MIFREEQWCIRVLEVSVKKVRLAFFYLQGAKFEMRPASWVSVSRILKNARRFFTNWTATPHSESDKAYILLLSKSNAGISDHRVIWDYRYSSISVRPVTE